MRLLPVIALPLFLIAVPLLSRGERFGSAHERLYVPLQAPEAAVAGEKKGLAALDFAPFEYFNSACARCHGENGSNYGDVLKGHGDARLREGIHAMAVGPGQSPLDEAQLDVVTRWHRALIDGKPFAHLAKAEASEGKTVLSGEATPDAKVTLKAGGSSYEATRDGLAWKVEVPGEVDLEAAELSAEK